MLLVAHRTPVSEARCVRLAAAGANVFEVDVQLRGDRLVVSHFLPLALPLVGPDRLQRDNWRLRWHSGASSDPALADVDAFVPAGCAVLLDVKETGAERRALLLERLGRSLSDRPGSAERYVVCSPFADDLRRARSAGFRTWRTAGDRKELAAALAGGLDEEALSVRHSLLDETVIRRLREVTDGLVAWTVNDVGRARALRRWGIGGVTTDRLAVVAALSSGPHAH